jgi:hypothetical protein
MRSLAGLILLVASLAASAQMVVMSRGGTTRPDEPLLAKKWEPGNYLLLYAGDSNDLSADAATLTSRCNEVGAESSVSGMMIRVPWDELESTQGNYDFSPIDTLLTCMGGHEKYLWLLILDRYFGAGPTFNCPVPTYVRNLGGTDNGCMETNTGSMAALHRTAIMDRQIALFDAICEYYEDEPYFHGFYPEESAPAQGQVGAPGDFTNSGYVAQLIRRDEATALACVKSLYMSSINFPTNDTLMIDMVSSAHAAGIGIGGPDVWANEAATRAQSVYIGNVGGIDYRGDMPAGWMAQPEGIDDRTDESIYAVSHDTWQQHFMFWVRKIDSVGDGANAQWDDHILPALRLGLYPTVTDCPTNLTNGCN